MAKGLLNNHVRGRSGGRQTFVSNILSAFLGFDVHCAPAWRSAYVIMMIADVLALDRHQAFSNHHAGLTDNRGTTHEHTTQHAYRVSDINSSPPGRNGRHFTDDIFKCIFLNETFCILIRSSPKLVPKGPNDNKWALVRVMAWRRIDELNKRGSSGTRWLLYIVGFVVSWLWYFMHWGVKSSYITCTQSELTH